MPSYFYDGTVDYCICFLIFFILSLSSVRLLNSLFFLVSSPSLSLNCSQLSLSLFVLVVGPPLQCVGYGLVDWWISEFGVLGSVGFFFFLLDVIGS